MRHAMHDESRGSCTGRVKIKVADLTSVEESMDLEAAAIASVTIVCAVAAIQRVLAVAEVIFYLQICGTSRVDIKAAM